MSMVVRGTLLQRYYNSAWQTIAGVQNLNIGKENEQVDLTTIADAARVRKAALKNLGPWSFTLLFDDAVTAHDAVNGLEADFNTGAQRDYRVLYVSGKWEQVNANVQNVSKALQIGQHVTASLQLSVNGDSTQG